MKATYDACNGMDTSQNRSQMQNLLIMEFCLYKILKMAKV